VGDCDGDIVGEFDGDMDGDCDGDREGDLSENALVAQYKAFQLSKLT
jgi:hypothetical protein